MLNFSIFQLIHNNKRNIHRIIKLVQSKSMFWDNKFTRIPSEILCRFDTSTKTYLQRKRHANN